MHGNSQLRPCPSYEVHEIYHIRKRKLSFWLIYGHSNAFLPQLIFLTLVVTAK